VAAEPQVRTTDFPSAVHSDPRFLGWMEGFPPPPDKLITQPGSEAVMTWK